MEAAKADGEPIGVALIDIDNFTLLNDHQGHRAGDNGAHDRARRPRRGLPAGGDHRPLRPRRVPRHRPADGSRGLEPAIEAVRDAPRRAQPRRRRRRAHPDHDQRRDRDLPEGRRLADRAARDRGLDARRGEGQRRRRDPRHRDRTASRTAAPRPSTSCRGWSSRSTRRTATRSGTPRTSRGTPCSSPARTASTRRRSARSGWPGCCTTSARSGCPTTSSASPGALTDDEYEIVKQHVVLGDLIVRDLPDTDAIRAGIRHHHERWDGTGYVDGLAGEDIPLIARIVAVADSFSAMTTSRPIARPSTPTRRSAG